MVSLLVDIALERDMELMCQHLHVMPCSTLAGTLNTR